VACCMLACMAVMSSVRTHVGLWPSAECCLRLYHGSDIAAKGWMDGQGICGATVSRERNNGSMIQHPYLQIFIANQCCSQGLMSAKQVQCVKQNFPSHTRN
jgi:hypothetical protein